MTREELLERLLDEEGIPFEWCVYGEKQENDQKTCIAPRAGKWVVYYSERGKESDVTPFEQEAEACQELYNRMLAKKALHEKLRQEGKRK